MKLAFIIRHFLKCIQSKIILSRLSSIFSKNTFRQMFKRKVMFFYVLLCVSYSVGCHCERLYLLWIFSSTFSAQKAFTSKSTPQAFADKNKKMLLWSMKLCKALLLIYQNQHHETLFEGKCTFPVSSGPGCNVTEQGKFGGICEKMFDI